MVAVIWSESLDEMTIPIVLVVDLFHERMRSEGDEKMDVVESWKRIKRTEQVHENEELCEKRKVEVEHYGKRS
jgi:hypothetical protein